jgi:hypothetical protein
MSLAEKTWIALMAVALIIAAINATAGDRLSGDDDRGASTPLKRVFIELVMK